MKTNDRTATKNTKKKKKKKQNNGARWPKLWLAFSLSSTSMSTSWSGRGRGWWDSFEKVAIHRRPIGASTPAISSLGRRFLFYFLRRLLLGPYGRWMALSLKKKHRHWLISLSCLPSFLPGFLKFFSFRFGFQQDKLSQVNWLWIYFFKRVFLTFFLRSNLFIMKFYLVLLGFFCYFHIFLFKLAFN